MVSGWVGLWHFVRCVMGVGSILRGAIVRPIFHLFGKCQKRMVR